MTNPGAGSTASAKVPHLVAFLIVGLLMTQSRASDSTSSFAAQRKFCREREQRGPGRPLVVHLVYRFDTGGLENGVVNLINHMPAERLPACGGRADRGRAGVSPPHPA